MVIFSFIGNFFSIKMPKKAKRPNKFFKANQLELRPKKGQIKFFRPTGFKQSQISEIWPKKGQPGNPGSGFGSLQQNG